MGVKSCLSCMSEGFKGPLISLDGPHSTFEVYFGPDNMPKLFFLSGGGDRPRFDSTHQNGCISCMPDTGRCRFHFRHILPWQHRPTAAFQHKDAFLVHGLGGGDCDRQIPFSISWWKLAEARVVWFQWSSKDWGRAIRRTPGLPFWISGLIVERTCGSESSRTTQKHRNNQQSLKGPH